MSVSPDPDILPPRHRAFGPQRLHARLILSFLLVVLVPALTLPIISLRYLYVHAIEAMERDSLSAANNRVRLVENMLESRSTDVLLVSQFPSVRRFHNAPDAAGRLAELPSLVRELRAHARKHPGLFAGVRLLDVQGGERLRVGPEGEPALLEQPPPSRAPYFTGAISLAAIRGQKVPVHVSHPDPAGPLYYSTLLANDAGILAGVLVLEVPVLPMLEPLVPHGPGPLCRVLDAEGRVLHASPGAESACDPHVGGEMLARDQGILKGAGGELHVYSRIRPAGQSAIQWTAVYDLTTETVQAPFRHATWMVFYATLGTVLLAVLVALWFSRQVTRPLTQLSLAARDACHGYWETLLPEPRHEDEVAELTRSFGSMTRQLRAAYDNLLDKMKDLEESESRLSAEKERLSVTLRSIGDGVIAADTAGRVLLLNRVAEELTGWTSAEAVGKPLAEVFRLRDEQTRKPLDDFLAKVFASEGVIELNAPMLLVNREGKEVLVADSAAPIRNPASEVVGAVVVFRDVTEARRNAQEHNRLEKLKSLGVLAGGIAHDFNNLISVVMGDLSLLREKVAAGSEEGELTADALRATGQARALTQQLLTFSKGGAPVKRSSSIRELVEESALFALHGSPCKCVCSAPPDLWLAEVDLGQIHQVVHNLALNAVQAMPGGGTLDIRMENVFLEEGGEAGLAAGRYIRITFRDEGSGIPPENLPKIFDPYFTTKSTGTGLGLSTAYGIVDRHQGRITVMSDRSGSTFRIHLPALGISATPEGEAPTDSAAGGKSGKILVLDDDPAIQRICRRLLEHLGHQVEVAGTCDDAVAAYRKAFAAGAPPDLVILDLTIPGGRGGLAVLGELKEIDPKVRALVSSGYSQDPVMAHYREHGFVGLLRKPYALKELKETLAAVL